MTLPEIFVQLPERIATRLEYLLEHVQLPAHPNREQVLAAAIEINTELQYLVGFGDDDTWVLELLDKVPQAIVNQLF